MASERREEVLRDLNVEHHIRRLGINVKSQDARWLTCLCPFHEDKQPSFRVALEETSRSSGGGVHEKGFWSCFKGCGSGSIFDLVIRIEGGNYDSAYLSLGGSTSTGSRRRNSKTRTSAKRSSEDAVPAHRIHQWQTSLWQDVQATRWLLEERGISPAVAHLAVLGLKRSKRGRWLTIPAFEKCTDGRKRVDHVKQIRIGPDRHVDDGNNFMNTKGANAGLHYPQSIPPGMINDKKGPLIFVESELDALLLISHGFKSFALRGTHGFRAERLLDYQKKFGTIVLWPDYDDAGQEALEKCGEGLQREGCEFGIMSLTIEDEDGKQTKDAGEVWQALECDSLKFIEWMNEAIRTVEVILPSKNHKVWQHITTASKDGSVRALRTVNNLLAIFEHDERFTNSLWMNEMGRQHMLDEKRISDDAIFAVRAQLEASYGVDWGNENVFQAMRSACMANQIHPVREYLKSLEWDGERRISQMLDDYVVMARDQDEDLKKVYLRKWMIGTVARVFQPGCKMDNMLVLYSRQQGVGKSMLAAALAGEWFTDEPIRPDEKDCRMVIHQSWIIEVGELDATTRRRDLAELRAFISKTEDTLRLPFGRTAETYPRSFTFLGTTNDIGVVKEDDGRRYWPIEVRAIDVEGIEKIRDQLWAEAVTYYHNGEQWWLSPDQDRRRRADTEEHFTEEDPIVSLVIEACEKQDWRALDEGRIPFSKMTSWIRDRGVIANARVIQSAMRRAGMSRHRSREHGRYWAMPPSPAE